MPQKGQEKTRLPMIWQGRRVDQPQQQNDDPRLILRATCFLGLNCAMC